MLRKKKCLHSAPGAVHRRPCSGPRRSLCGGCVLTLPLVGPAAPYLDYNSLVHFGAAGGFSPSFSTFPGPHFAPSAVCGHLPPGTGFPGPWGSVLLCNWLHTSHPDVPRHHDIRPLAPWTLLFHPLYKQRDAGAIACACHTCARGWQPETNPSMSTVCPCTVRTLL